MTWYDFNDKIISPLHDDDYKKQLDAVVPLEDLIQKYQPEIALEDRYFLKEFVLWALSEHQKLGKDRLTDGFQFKDLLDIL